MSDDLQNDSYLAHVRHCEQTGEPQLNREQWYRQNAMNNRFIANHLAAHRSCGTCEHADFGMCAKSRMPCARCWQYDTLPKWEAKRPSAPNLPASIEPWQVPLWDEVNRYCDGNMVQRENAVVAILKVIRNAISDASADRNELLAGRAQATADANEAVRQLAELRPAAEAWQAMQERIAKGMTLASLGECLVAAEQRANRLQHDLDSATADRDILWDTVGYIFRRITEDADMAYHCCSSTETFARVARAVAHHAKMTEDEIKAKMREGMAGILDNPREVELQKRLDEAEQRIAVLEQLANPEAYLR